MYILCGFKGNLIFLQQNRSNPQIIAAYDTPVNKKTARYSKGVYQMSEYRLKTPQKVEKAAVGTYRKIEDTVVGAYKKVEETVVGAYQKVEDGVVGSYKKVEQKFVSAFLEKTDSRAQDGR